MKIYNTFEEVEKDLEEKFPSVIYKYRTWENDYHKKIITENEVWFAHPLELNDPYDIRPPLKLMSDNIDWDVARKKLIAAGRAIEPDLTDEELKEEVEKRIIEIKRDPISYFQKNRRDYIQDKTHYDNIGVFSCCSSFKNEAMWAHYGNNHTGFAIGLNTAELVRSLYCTFGRVEYKDDPIEYHLFGNNEDLIYREIFQKSTKWGYEDELRFITFRIGKNRNRASIFPISAVSEIVFGMTTSKLIEDEIKEIVKKKLPNIQVYKVETNDDQFGFKKNLIS